MAEKKRGARSAVSARAFVREEAGEESAPAIGSRELADRAKRSSSRRGLVIEKARIERGAWIPPVRNRSEEQCVSRDRRAHLSKLHRCRGCRVRRDPRNRACDAGTALEVVDRIDHCRERLGTLRLDREDGGDERFSRVAGGKSPHRKTEPRASGALETIEVRVDAHVESSQIVEPRVGRGDEGVPPDPEKRSILGVLLYDGT
jgi:hypothetical protein